MGLTDFVKAIIKRETKVQSFNAEVLEVNESEGTCKVLIEEGLELFGVRLLSVIDDIKSPCLILPKVGSIVMCTIIENDVNEVFVSKVSEVDKYLFVVGDYSVKLDKEGIVLNGGNFGGLIKIQELVQSINTIESAVNQLKTEFSAHTHTTPTAAAPTTPSTPPLLPSTVQLVTTQKSTLENPKVTH